MSVLRGVLGAALAAALVLTVACGGDSGSSPTTPTPPQPANIAGSWSGTFESSNYAARAVALAITQASAAVSGTWQTSPDDWNGTISGSTDTSRFVGTFTYSAPAAGGGRCTGTLAFSGPATGTTLRWTSPGVAGGNCTGTPVNVILNIQRR